MSALCLKYKRRIRWTSNRIWLEKSDQWRGLCWPRVSTSLTLQSSETLHQSMIKHHMRLLNGVIHMQIKVFGTQSSLLWLLSRFLQRQYFWFSQEIKNIHKQYCWYGSSVIPVVVLPLSLSYVGVFGIITEVLAPNMQKNTQEEQGTNWFLFCFFFQIILKALELNRYTMVLLVCRINAVMDTLKMVLEYFFVSWFVVFVWNFMVNPSSLDDTTTQFFWYASKWNLLLCLTSNNNTHILSS